MRDSGRLHFFTKRHAWMRALGFVVVSIPPVGSAIAVAIAGVPIAVLIVPIAATIVVIVVAIADAVAITIAIRCGGGWQLPLLRLLSGIDTNSRLGLRPNAPRHSRQ